MRILLVSHLFPPAHEAGTEVYSAELGRRLRDAGHEVSVFTTDKDIGREDLSLVRREHDGLPVVELTNNLYYERFEDTWRHAEVERIFAEHLDAVRPDVVHFQHLLYLSVGCVRVAAERGLPVLMTLHDFWLMCPRFGQLLHDDGSLCHEVDFARCGTCLPSFKWRQSSLERTTGRAIAQVHAKTGIDLGPLARGARKLAAEWKRGRDEDVGDDASAPSELTAAYEAAARDRASEVRELALAHVDRFVSPSEFLRDRFVDWGFPSDRVCYVPTGIDLESFGVRERDERAPDDPLRVLFLGTFVEKKGAHLLVDAWRRVPAEERAGASLTLHGPGDYAPEYVARLRDDCEAVGATLGGPLGRDEVPVALADADLLVVPSLWFENRPLVVLEALASRTPLLVSEPGGMAELVEEGVTGWRFPIGDAEELARRLRELVRDPGRARSLYRSALRLPTWEELTSATLDLYAEVIAGK